MSKPRVIAFYLPQFHPIPENNLWWGNGFTEWTNVAKAKKLFPGHYQPKIPADLGFYDLRLPETRIAQAELAKKAGIEGFCYWHYWFKKDSQLLEQPFNEVLSSGKPDFPFCLAWANESWQKKMWNKDLKGNKVLIEQEYGGIEDYTAHFYSVLPAFKDNRYIKVDDKPLFMIYKPLATPKIKDFMNCWNELAKKEGLKGIFWIAQTDMHLTKKHQDLLKDGFNAINVVNLDSAYKNPFLWRAFTCALGRILNFPIIASFKTASKYIIKDIRRILQNPAICPTIITGWDHTPRSVRKGFCLTHYTPKLFSKYVNSLFNAVKDTQKVNGGGYSNIVFLKSWNEWGEGNYIEPDLRYGCQFLDELKKQIDLF